MITVSDTTPIHYLILIGKEQILPILFNEIIIPEAVIDEMQHPEAPLDVRRWIISPPNWVRIGKASAAFLEEIVGLGQGETEAIAIAIERNAEAVLIDDRRGIREARFRKLKVLTTFSVLELASGENLLDFTDVVARLSKTTFRMPPDEVLQEYLNRNAQRNSA